MNGSIGRGVPLRSHARKHRTFCMKISVIRRSRQQRKHSKGFSLPVKSPTLTPMTSMPSYQCPPISALLSVLEQNGIAFHEDLWHAVTLTSYASDTRYPGFDKPVTKDEYDNAIILAHMILCWAEEQIE